MAYWTYSVAFEPDIERGIQIRWTGNRAAVPQSTIVKKEKEFGYRANNFSLGNGSPIPGSTDLNATFNVGFKSNWVRLLMNPIGPIMEITFKIFLPLKEGGQHKILFFVGQESGRPRNEDITTMNLVLEAAPEIGKNYGIILPKIPKKMAKSLYESNNWGKFLAGVFAGNQNIEAIILSIVC